MSKCDICEQETGKQAEQRVGDSYNTVTKQHTRVPYTMPIIAMIVSRIDQCLNLIRQTSVRSRENGLPIAAKD